MPECFLASPKYLGMCQGVLYGGSVISISVVRVRAMGELHSGNMNQNGCITQQRQKSSPGNRQPPCCRHASHLYGNSSDLRLASRGELDLHMSGVTP